MQVITFDKTRLRTLSHVKVMRNCLEYANVLAGMNNARLNGLRLTLAACADREENDFNISQGSKYTAEITEADYKRDRAWGIIGNVVRGFEQGYGTAEQTAAAKAILEVVNKQKVAVNDDFTQETGMIDKFALHADPLAAEFATLNLTAIYAALKEGNATVNEFIMKRQTERADLAVGAIKADRAATDAAYTELIQYVEALAIVTPAAQLDTFIKQWNSYLNYIREHSLDDAKVKDENEYGAEDDGTVTVPDAPEGDGGHTETPTPPAQGNGGDGGQTDFDA